MFAAGVIGGDGKQRQPIVSFYDPRGAGTVAKEPGTQDVVVVDGIRGKCLISVYAINCDWEVGMYGCNDGRDAPESSQTIVWFYGQATRQRPIAGLR